MATTVPAPDHHVLTLEEIGSLAQRGGKPAETLMNVVALIAKRFQTEVCSAYLLEPDRANLVLAATVGLSKECIGTLRLGLHEGLAGLVAEEVRAVAVYQVNTHPRYKYFGGSGEENYQSFLGVPVVERGILQGVLVLQTIEPRTFTNEEIRMLTEAATEVAPVIGEARNLARFIAPTQERLWALARNLWWSWDYEVTGIFRDLDPVRFRELNHNPISLLSEMPLAAIERRAGEMMLHSRINYAYRRLQEYLKQDRTWGATYAGVLRPRPNSASTNPCLFTPAASACSPATTSRAPPTSTFPLSPSASSTLRVTSASASTRAAGRWKTTFPPTSPRSPWSPPSEPTEPR